MSTIRKAFQFRLYPNKEQQTALDQTLWLCRDLYNAALYERREAYRLGHVTLSYNFQQNELPAVKVDCPEYTEVHSQVLQDMLRRLDKAYQAFFRRVKAGEKPGFPRFQGRGRYNSLTYPQYGNGARLDYDEGKWGVLTLAKLGSFKVRMHRPIEGTIKTVTVRRDGEHWYVSFSCEIEVPDVVPASSGAAIGIDLGLLHFATLSDGEQVDNPRLLRRAAKKLKVAGQKLSRCKRGSHRRDRARREVRRLHRKVRNQRADFLHKLSRRLVQEHEVIVFEDLAISNLVKRPKAKVDADQSAASGTTVYASNGAAAKSGLNKSISDAGWRQFQQQCVAKAAWAGRRVLFVNPAYTSQTCSGCGVIGKKELSERWHSCPECGTELDRDVNAAINILRLGRSQQAVPVCRSPAL